MIKLTNKFTRLLLIFGISIWLFVTIMLFFQKYSLNFMFNLLSSFILTTGLFVLYNFLKNKSKKTIDIVSFIMCILAFILLCYVGFNSKVSLLYDLDIIFDQVKLLLNSGSKEIYDSTYFSVYQHQIPLFCLIYYVSSIGSIFNLNPLNSMILFNSFMIFLLYIYTYKITYLITKKASIAFISLLLILFVPSIYLLSSYFYTDIVSIPICLMGIYYILKGDMNNKNILLIIGGLLLGISAKIRILNLIILIALFIYKLFNIKFKKLLKNSLIVVLSIIIVNFIYSNFIYTSFKFNLKDEYKFPASHWVMMGLNSKSKGKFCIEDYYITFNSKDKTKTNVSKIKERIKSTSLFFYLKKEAGVFSSIDYGMLEKFQTTNNYTKFNKIINSKYSIYIKYFSTIILFIIYTLFILSMIYTYKRKDLIKEKFIIFFLTVIGGVIFYIFWESNIRYGITFLPWIIIGSSLYIDKFSSKFLEEKNINKIKKLYILVFILISICFMYGYKSYCFKKTNNKKLVFSQGYDNNSISIVKNKVKVNFSVDNDFSSILCNFKRNNSTNIDYYFELYNNDNKLLYKEKFSLDDNSKIFEFDKQEVNSLSNYYFIIYSLSATYDDHYSLAMYLPDTYNMFEQNIGYDISKYESIYSDNKLLRGEAVINAENDVYDYLINPIIYIMVWILASIEIIFVYYLLHMKKIY